MPERGLGRFIGDTFEFIETNGTNSVLVVGLALEIRSANGNAGSSGIRPGAIKATVTRSLRAFMQVIRAMPANKICTWAVSAVSCRITDRRLKLVSVSTLTSKLSSVGESQERALRRLRWSRSAVRWVLISFKVAQLV